MKASRAHDYQVGHFALQLGAAHKVRGGLPGGTALLGAKKKAPDQGALLYLVPRTRLSSYTLNRYA